MNKYHHSLPYHTQKDFKTCLKSHLTNADFSSEYGGLNEFRLHIQNFNCLPIYLKNWVGRS